MPQHDDKATMEYLLARSTLVLCMARGQHGGGREYKKELDVTSYGWGSGVLVERNGTGFVATNEHVLRARIALKDIPVSVMVAVESGGSAAEDHANFVVSQRTFADDGTGHAVLDTRGFPVPADAESGSDLGVIKLSKSSFQRAAHSGKKFVAWPLVAEALAVGDKVCFRGYPTGQVDIVLDPAPRIAADGFTMFSDVVGISGNRISLDVTEVGICYGKGTTQSSRDLHGISGSGVFDIEGHLRAIVWGGDQKSNLVYACPAGLLGPLFDALDSRNGHDALYTATLFLR